MLESVNNTGHHTDIDQLLSELSYYRRQSERLQKVNELYCRIAAVVNLPSMLETYSVWLSQYVPHLLIGYNNPNRKRMHLYCSNHGPDRRKAIETAETCLLESAEQAEQDYESKNYHVHRWLLESDENSKLLLLLRKDFSIPRAEMDLINDSLATIAEPLNKALEYEEISQQARKDSLTGLPNRFVFSEQIDSILERARRQINPVTIAAMDLDKFKLVNDTRGHMYGDMVLKKVARAMQKQIRVNDLLVRMGGDEFLLVLSDTDLQAAKILCERLCRAVDDLDVFAGTERLGLSIGLIEWDRQMSTETWLEKADDMLYQAKARGGSAVASDLYDPGASFHTAILFPVFPARLKQSL